MRIATDTAVIIVSATTLVTFIMVSQFGSVWTLYPNLVFTIGWFGYWLRQREELTRCILFGCAAIVIYLPIDWLFSRKARFLFYLDSEFERLGVPVALVLTWVIFAALMAYCYERSLRLWPRRLFAAAVTGCLAGLGSFVIYALGDSRLWVWNALRVDTFPQIASVPLFVPLAFLLTFLLCPYYFHREQHPVVAGIRCGIFMGALQFFTFLFFYISVN